METVVILLVLLTVFAAVSFPASQMSLDSSKDVAAVAMADQFLANLANAANLVGISGTGASVRIKVQVPPRLESIEAPIGPQGNTRRLEVTLKANDDEDARTLTKEGGPALTYESIAGTITLFRELDYNIVVPGANNEFAAVKTEFGEEGGVAWVTLRAVYPKMIEIDFDI